MAVNKPWLSIIIPVYNVEKYIEICLKSIECNDTKNVEVIIVDDGSDDNSAKICETWADIHQNFLFIQKKNGGSVSARNFGFKKSSGDWIWFVDADDCIAPTALASLFKRTRDTKSEVLNFDCVFFRNKDYPMWNQDTTGESELISVSDFRNRCYENQCLKFNWSFVYKRELLRRCMLDNERLFNEDIILYEDVLFCERFTRQTEFVEILHECLYGCRHNVNSVTNKRSNQSAISGLNAIKLIDKFEAKSSIGRNKNIMEIGLLFSIYKLIEDCPDSNILKITVQQEIRRRVCDVGFFSLPFRLKIRYCLLVTGIMDIVIKVR